MQRAGLPEFVAAALMGLVVVSALCWWKERSRPLWSEAEGRVVACEIRQTHFNAPATRQKVAVTYEYAVGGIRFVRQWEGYWPKVHSPNALPDGRIEALRHKGYPLVVLFDPSNPGSSQLHNPNPERSLWLQGLALGTVLASLVYFVKLYPAWKRRLA